MKSFSPEDRAYEATILALLSFRGVGRRSVSGFLATGHRPKSGCDLYALVQEGALARLAAQPSREAVHRAWEGAERTLEECENAGVLVLGGQRPLPALLEGIPDRPRLIYLQGDIDAVISPGIAVIGTRHPTDFGRRSANRIARVLGERNWTVVSGLAEGCDAAGHEGCLAAGGKTVAVLAHGFGRIYPAKNRHLAERILEAGALITEYPPGRPPTRSTFVERDRLQSGLSLGIVVVEAGVRSGTMHTVRHAQAQGRGIAAVAHPENLVRKPAAQGNQKLIRQGVATPLADRDDLLRFAEELAAEQPTHA